MGIAGFINIAILSFLIVFHLGVLLGIFPYTMIGGGRIKTKKAMYRLESIALVLITFFLWVSLQKFKLITVTLSQKTIDIILWVVVVYFAINVFTNLLSKNAIEKYLFSIIALALSISTLLILI